jgi:hypothetical protein
MSSDPTVFNGDDAEFEQAIIDLRQSLVKIEQRYIQIKQDLQHQAQLHQRLEEVEREWNLNQLPELEKELLQIRSQVQELSVALESALLSNQDFQQLFWKGVKQGLLGEVFWQIVRFGGLGIVIGWFLKTWAG